MTRLFLLIAVLLIVTLVGTPAAAHGGEAPRAKTTVSELPPGPVKRLLLDIKKLVREGKHDPKIVEQPIGEAVRAAERARGARESGDKKNGTLLDKLATQWASAGKAVVRAVQAEQAAKEEAARVQVLATKVSRAEALLHEQQARLGRLRAEKKRLEAKAKKKADKSAEAEKDRLKAAGKKKKGKKGTKGKKVTPKKKAQP